MLSILFENNKFKKSIKLYLKSQNNYLIIFMKKLKIMIQIKTDERNKQNFKDKLKLRALSILDNY